MPPLNEDTLTSTDKEMRRRAHRIAYLRARDDRIAMEDDLVQAGWLGFLNCHDERWRWFDADRAMTSEWLRWRFGIAYRWEPLRKELVEPLEFSDVQALTIASTQASPEEMVYAGELFRKMKRVVEKKKVSTYKTVFNALLLNGDAREHLPENLRRQINLKKSCLSVTKRRLQRLLRPVITSSMKENS